MKWLMSVYASYLLPLAIVGVPMLWKKLYDSAPDSLMRVAVLEAEAKLRSRLVDVEREQNDLLVDAYREALDTPRVKEARRALFEQASIEHARNITGFIEGAETHAQEPTSGTNMQYQPTTTARPAYNPPRWTVPPAGRRGNGSVLY
jgi:hypothetical protein